MDSLVKGIRVEQVGGPEVMKIASLGPLVPGPGQALVALEAAGVNPVDTYIRAGTYTIDPALPYTPGLEGAGTVLEIGDGVSHISAGQRIYIGARPLTGTYAEQCLCSAQDLLPLPDALSTEEGAALFITYATAYRALVQLGRAKPGQRVLIRGASGGVGTAAAQWARWLGLDAVGTAGTTKGAELVRQQGLQTVLDHHAPDFDAQAMAATGEQGYDIILEMAAHLNLDSDLDLVARGGSVMVVGNRGELTINPRKMMGKESVVRGVMLFAMGAAERLEFAAAVEASARAGVLRPVIGRRFVLKDAPQAHRAVMEPGAYGKIVLTTGG